MSLLTYTPIEDGSEADDQLFNARFQALHDVINGNLDASNLADNAVTTAKIANDAVTTAKIVANSTSKATLVLNLYATGTGGPTTPAWYNPNGWSGTWTSENGGNALALLYFSMWKSSTVGKIYFRIKVGSSYFPTSAGVGFFINQLNTHVPFSLNTLVSGIAAGAHTVSIELNFDSGNIQWDLADFCSLTMVELKR